MSRVEHSVYGLVRVSRFPLPLFVVILVGLMLASGIHEGLILLVYYLSLSDLVLVHVILVYWALVSVSMTLLIRYLTKTTYEKPVQQLAEATRKVAEGDFSVYVPPIHTADKLDYLDVMILDFNKMVAELGSIETLKTDFFSNVSHEIKTPLAVIHNAAQLLKNENLSAERRAESVDTIEKYSGRLAELIADLGLSDRVNHLPNQLSGGQQQRVSIGRALINRPAIVLADEPTGNLDSKSSDEIVELLKISNRKYDQTIIMITHNLEIAKTADRILTMEDGRLVREG